MFTGFLAPVAIVAAVAVSALVLPSVRWTRQLKRDSEIFSTMPEGVERQRWAESVALQATRLRIYEASVPVWDRAASWIFTTLYVLALAAWLSGALTAAWGDWAWVVLGTYCLFGSYVIICLVRGLPVFTSIHPTYRETRTAMRQLRLRQGRWRVTRKSYSRRPGEKESTQSGR